MNQEATRKINFALLIVVILCLIVLSIIAFKIIKGEGECVLNPMGFYLKDKENVKCTCEVTTYDQSQIPFNFQPNTG